MRALGKGAQAGYARWCEAMRWQRAVDKALRPLGLTHTQLLALAAVSHAFEDEIDGATQVSIARAAGLDRVTTATVLRTLESHGFVTRDVIDGDHRSWSICATPRGERILATAALLVEQVSAEGD
jgi:MarR family transcriptional regulator, organic hydroperoxide resistance regulator